MRDAEWGSDACDVIKPGHENEDLSLNPSVDQQTPKSVAEALGFQRCRLSFPLPGRNQTDHDVPKSKREKRLIQR